MFKAEVVFWKRACISKSYVIVAVAEAKSEKAIFIFRGNSSTPKQKYLFSVSVHKYFIKTAKNSDEGKQLKPVKHFAKEGNSKKFSSTENLIGKTTQLAVLVMQVL